MEYIMNDYEWPDRVSGVGSLINFNDDIAIARMLETPTEGTIAESEGLYDGYARTLLSDFRPDKPLTEADESHRYDSTARLNLQYNGQRSMLPGNNDPMHPNLNFGINEKDKFQDMTLLRKQHEKRSRFHSFKPDPIGQSSDNIHPFDQQQQIRDMRKQTRANYRVFSKQYEGMNNAIRKRANKQSSAKACEILLSDKNKTKLNPHALPIDHRFDLASLAVLEINDKTKIAPVSGKKSFKKSKISARDWKNKFNAVEIAIKNKTNALPATPSNNFDSQTYLIGNSVVRNNKLIANRNNRQKYNESLAMLPNSTVSQINKIKILYDKPQNYEGVIANMKNNVVQNNDTAKNTAVKNISRQSIKALKENYVSNSNNKMQDHNFHNRENGTILIKGKHVTVHNPCNKLITEMKTTSNGAISQNMWFNHFTASQKINNANLQKSKINSKVKENKHESYGNKMGNFTTKPVSNVSEDSLRNRKNTKSEFYNRDFNK